VSFTKLVIQKNKNSESRNMPFEKILLWIDFLGKHEKNLIFMKYWMKRV
jgi:hypothetical protein